MINFRRMFSAIALTMTLGAPLTINAQTLDVDRQLKYCSTQVHRALDELRRKDGTYDFTMQPRNILNGDKQRDGTVDRLRRRSGVTVFGPAYCG